MGAYKSWETEAGEVIPITKLGDDHLNNCIKMLQRKYTSDRLRTHEKYHWLLEEKQKRFRRKMHNTKLGKYLYDLYKNNA